MKYIIIPYIAFGLVLSLIIGVEYNCSGQEMFPEYYGSPFVFKQKSLGSSMEYYFSISGLLLNTIVWCIPLILIRLVVFNLIEKTKHKKIINLTYKGVIIVLIGFTTLNIAIDSVMIGNGFKKGFNYWYMDLDKEAKDWGMECEGKLIMLKK